MVRRACLVQEPEGVGVLTPAGVAFFMQIGLLSIVDLEKNDPENI